jgi:hypothetical protein
LDDDAEAPAMVRHAPKARSHMTLAERNRQERDEIDAEKWIEVRPLMEGHVLADAAIAQGSGFSIEDILVRAESEGWAIGHRLDGSLRSQLLSRRLMAVLEKQVESLEQSDMTDNDKRSAMLGKLTTTLDKIMEIQGQNGGPGIQSESREMRDMRNKLARRIDNLKRK